MERGRNNDWIDLEIPPSEFRAESSLETGQCFHWKRIAANEWLGLVTGCCVHLRSAPNTTLVKSLAGELDVQSFCRYLSHGQGHPVLVDLQTAWGEDGAEAARILPGARVLRQDPVEALISFICSANNNVPRISLMLERLRQQAGTPLLNLSPTLAGQMAQEYSKGRSAVPAHVRELISQGKLCSFPTPERLASFGELELQELGLGYRARYVAASVMAGDLKKDLEELRRLPRDVAERELRKFSGVGPKVAACVALYGLGFSDSVPVDVHVARAAGRMAPPGLARRLEASASLTPGLHAAVADFFRDRFGTHAGWAQHLVFAAQRHRASVAVKWHVGKACSVCTMGKSCGQNI